jgi:DNA polymerase
MADPKKTPEEIIDHVITFLKREREMYGDFSTRHSPDIPKKGSGNKGIISPDDAESEAKSNVDGISSFTSSPTAECGSQERLFNQGNTNENEIYQEIEKCNSLEELEALCQKADVLETDLKGTKLVFGVGKPNADLMLIGEAPGAEEDKQGEPFVGKAGQLLNQVLAAINFKREDVYIANILKHRPPNNRNPKPEERKRSLPFLLRQIDLVNPKVILCLGKVSAQTLLDKNLSLSKMRGKIHEFRNKYELVATYHPAALLRHPKWKRPTWEDVQLLRRRYDELGGKP